MPRRIENSEKFEKFGTLAECNYVENIHSIQFLLRCHVEILSQHPLKLQSLGKDNRFLCLFYSHFKKYSQQRESCRDRTHNVNQHDDVWLDIDLIRMIKFWLAIWQQWGAEICVYHRFGRFTNKIHSFIYTEKKRFCYVRTYWITLARIVMNNDNKDYILKMNFITTNWIEWIL